MRYFLVLIGLVSGLGTQWVRAEVVPDSTLNSQVTASPENTQLLITGGTQSGTTLFHSFQTFSIPNARAVRFLPDAQIQNIITRVTGSERSQIDGLLAVNGTANLFLLNPNGITFGQTAQLSINGSFFASTADSLKFSDGSEFSAKTPEAPLLTISTPIGLQFGTRPGSIVSQSDGLIVPPQQTLALLGGDMQITGGSLTASTGKVLLASVMSPGFFSLTQPNSLASGTLELSNNTLINTSGLSGGRVEIQGGTVLLSNARILSLTLGNQDGAGIGIRANQLQIQDGTQIISLTTQAGKGGDIDLSATQSITMRGLGIDPYQQLAAALIAGNADFSNPAISLNASTTGTGRGGNITLSADQIRFENGVALASATTQSGRSGMLTLQAKEINVVRSGLFSGSLRGSTGAGGAIEVKSDRLTLREGAALVSSTFGQGNSGNITLNIKDSILLTDSPTGAIIQTLIALNTLGGSQARGGDLSIETKRLQISGGAGISSGTGGWIGAIPILSTSGSSGDVNVRATESVELSGISEVLANGTQTSSYIATGTASLNPGGNILITTPLLRVRSGGLISTGSFGFSRAGDITINADRLEISGQTDSFISKIETATGLFNVYRNDLATANAGNLRLTVRDLVIQDGAMITAQNIGSGKAGNIDAIANTISLDNRASINAKTGTAGGGNVNLRSQTILLRRGSQIQTDANRSDGGNIDITTRFLLAIPNENSDITANAESGRGGNIDINAQSILGLQQRPKLSDFSDITASSGIGLDGTVTLTPFNQPIVTQALPIIPLNSTSQIAQTCSSKAKNNSFTVIGRGGIAPDLAEINRPTPIWVDRRAPQKSTLQISPSQEENLVPAAGWIKSEDGTVTLVADASSPNNFSMPQPLACANP
jgi:filamentous hemagglutinin family protein